MAVSDFTNKDNYTRILQYVTNDAAAIKINKSTVVVENGEVSATRSALKTVNDTVTNVADYAGVKAVELVNYMAPVKVVYDSAYKIGQEFDEIIKDNLVMQTMNIKGSDILCSAFCIIISFLPCKTRNDLYEAILDMQRGAAVLGQAASAINEAVKTYNAAMAGIDSVIAATEGLFSNNIIDTAFNSNEEGITPALGGSTVSAAITSVEKVAETIGNVLEVLCNGTIQAPVNVTSRIWDLAKSVLYQLQSMALELANEAIDKIIAPIENLILDWIPSECALRGYASVLFNKIIGGIKKEKQWILQQIADLFSSGIDYKKAQEEFTHGSISVMEVKAFIDAIKMISHRFGDLAIACGISPCSELDDSSKSKASALKNGNLIPEAMGESSTIADLPITSNNLDDISESLGNILGIDSKNIVATDDKISFIYNAAENAPKKIVEFYNSGILGSDYSIFNDGNTIKVVHTFKRMCLGE
jgi:hypothetical protein